MQPDMQSKRWIRTDTILLTAGLLLIAYLLGEVLLLVFAAVVLAVGLDGAAQGVARKTPVSRGWGLVGVAVATVGLVAAALFISARRLVQQFRELGVTVIDSAEGLQAWLTDIGAMDVVEQIEDAGDGIAGAARNMAAQMMTMGLSVVGALTSMIVLIVLTIFLSANPGLYRRGAVRLVPQDRRPMIEDTLSAIAHALRWWFLGQLASMLLLGVTVGLGLFFLGVDLWFALAVLAAVLTSIPFIGPLIATVPIVAVGFADGMQTGLIVLVGYIVIQNIEGNIMTPMIQHKAVDLPPALLIAVQVMLTLIFGIAGLILAAPLTVVGMVAVQKMWVEHTLGEKVT